MTKPGHGHRTKVCPRCRKRKTVSARNFTYSTANGKRFFKHCRMCDRAMKRAARELRLTDPEKVAAHQAYQREWNRKNYAKDPEAAKRASREWKRKLREKDPARAFELLTLPKRFKRESRDYAQVRAKTIEPYAKPTRWADPIVPAGPLVAYLRDTFPGWAPGEVSSHLGLPPRAIYGLLTEQVDQVLLSTADLILTAGLARPDLLNAFYPFEGRSL